MFYGYLGDVGRVVLGTPVPQPRCSQSEPGRRICATRVLTDPGTISQSVFIVFEPWL